MPSDSPDLTSERPPDSPRDRAVEAAAVREALERVLASHAFKKSEQCQRFLRYVVEHRGEPELLRERSIGVEVFGRKPDYDTAEDPIVRVRATEVRKRLAQAYGESGKDDEVRFEIPAGSYRVELHWSPAKPAPVVVRPRPRSALALARGGARCSWPSPRRSGACAGRRRPRRSTGSGSRCSRARSRCSSTAAGRSSTSSPASCARSSGRRPAATRSIPTRRCGAATSSRSPTSSSASATPTPPCG